MKLRCGADECAKILVAWADEFELEDLRARLLASSDGPMRKCCIGRRWRVSRCERQRDERPLRADPAHPAALINLCVIYLQSCRIVRTADSRNVRYYKRSGTGRRGSETGARPVHWPKPALLWNAISSSIPRLATVGTTQGYHQKWTAITLGGPAVPDITLAESTTCMFLLDQSRGARITASAKYFGLVRNSAAAVVP